MLYELVISTAYSGSAHKACIYHTQQHVHHYTIIETYAA